MPRYLTMDGERTLSYDLPYWRKRWVILEQISPELRLSGPSCDEAHSAQGQHASMTCMKARRAPLGWPSGDWKGVVLPANQRVEGRITPYHPQNGNEVLVRESRWPLQSFSPPPRAFPTPITPSPCSRKTGRALSTSVSYVRDYNIDS